MIKIGNNVIALQKGDREFVYKELYDQEFFSTAKTVLEDKSSCQIYYFKDPNSPIYEIFIEAGKKRGGAGVKIMPLGHKGEFKGIRYMGD